jgi:hypothetical protein
MSRQRLHYSKDEIINNLYAFTNTEWMLPDNTPYAGPYHKYTTGEVYTEAMWDEQLSKPLVPYQDTKSPKFRYKQLKSKLKTKYDSIEQHFLQISYDAFKAGYVDRYFIKKVNELEIIEISSKTYDDYGSSKIDPNLYIVVKLKWYIAGDTVSAVVNGVSNKTVQDKNLAELYKAEKTMPGITLKLPNLIEYYTDNEYIVPADINQSV